MSDPFPGWQPGRFAVHRLIEFLDVMAIGLNRFQQRTMALLPGDTLAAKWERHEEVCRLSGEYRALAHAICRPEIGFHIAAGALADAVVSEFARVGRADAEPLVDRAARLLTALCGLYPTDYPADPSDEEKNQRFEAEGNLRWEYAAVRAALRRLIARVGRPIPDDVRRRDEQVFNHPGCWDNGITQEVLIDWIRAAKPSPIRAEPDPREAETVSRHEEARQLTAADFLRSPFVDPSDPRLADMQVVPHPEEEMLQRWLAIETVGGKFVPGWTRFREMAQFWHLDPNAGENRWLPVVEGHMRRLLRGSVGEDELIRFLHREHGLDPADGVRLRLSDLVTLLARPDRSDREEAPATAPAAPPERNAADPPADPTAGAPTGRVREQKRAPEDRRLGRTPTDPEWAATAISIRGAFAKEGRTDWQGLAKELRKQVANGDAAKEGELRRAISPRSVKQYFQNRARRKC